MKNYVYIRFIIILSLLFICAPSVASLYYQEIDYCIDKEAAILDGLSLSTTTTWHEFYIDDEYLQEENCAWLSSIQFKSKNAINLKELCLNWQGTLIQSNKLSASLYTKKETNNQLLPLEQNLICDGKWNKNNQEIIFLLDEKLIAVNKYYLVISFPENLKNHLKQGSFYISENELKLESIN